MDNSPRWKGMANACPEGSAKNIPKAASLPRLCPDLSATTYGARIALAQMAHALGKDNEAGHWAERAEQIRQLILAKLYVAEDAAFYDLDAQNNFVKINCDILSRVCSEHVPDQKLFNTLWERQIHRPQGFWPRFPLPSSAMDEPSFVRPIPRNSWGGASQSLTAMRAPRWMDHYGRSADFAHMMDQWCEALQTAGSFRQQIDPVSGAITPEEAPNYSPSSLVMTTYTWRLAGVHEEGDELWWNVRANHPAAQDASFRMKTDDGKIAEMRYTKNASTLSLNSRTIATIESEAARLITDKSDKPKALVCIGNRLPTTSITLRIPGKASLKRSLRADQRLELTPDLLR
jgi:hypothetical protein